jgi:hypothetical protein
MYSGLENNQLSSQEAFHSQMEEHNQRCELVLGDEDEEFEYDYWRCNTGSVLPRVLGQVCNSSAVRHYSSAVV